MKTGIKENKIKQSLIKLPKFRDTIIMLPNVLTFIRILGVPFVVALIYFEGIYQEKFYGELAALIFILASITDFLDGYYARKMKLKSAFGKILDPLADKLLVVSILIMLASLDRVHVFIVIVITAREFIITALRTLASVAGIVIAADRLGKIKAFTQMVAIPALLFNIQKPYFNSFHIGTYLLYVSLFFSVISAFKYAKDFFEKAGDLKF